MFGTASPRVKLVAQFPPLALSEREWAGTADTLFAPLLLLLFADALLLPSPAWFAAKGEERASWAWRLRFSVPLNECRNGLDDDCVFVGVCACCCCLLYR